MGRPVIVRRVIPCQLLSACCKYFMILCNKAQMLLTPRGRVLCICKTACFLANYAPHSLQAGRKMSIIL